MQTQIEKMCLRAFLRAMGMSLPLIVLTMLGTIASPQTSAHLSPRRYNFKTIDFPRAASTQVFGINERGDVVGSYTDPGGGIIHGFQLSNGTFRTVDFPGAILTGARGINDKGEIGGAFTTSDDPNGGHGFVMLDGKFEQVDFPGSAHSGILGINENGDFTGSYDLGDINTGTGYFTRNHRFISFEVPGSATMTTGPHGINDAGQVTGFFTDGTDPNLAHAFLLSHGKFTTIDYPGASVTGFFGINEHGDLIGGCVCIDGRGHGLLFADGSFTIISDPDASVTRPRGINDRGQIVGFYQVAGSSATHGFIATPMPETE